jgi:histidinol-phosphate aminotransferase
MTVVMSVPPARAAFRSLELYTPDREACAVDLSDNTNLWGSAPSAVSAAAAASLTRYPSVYADGLRDALAAYVGVASECVVTGCGSDDVLDSAIRAFADPGDKLALSDPTFHMVPLFAKVNGLRLRREELTSVHDVDDDALLAARARITYLCSPNNPTGAAFSRERIERIAREAVGVVLLDEAYVEFAAASCVELVARYERLLVVRTMSKAFGLAGLRIGYAVGSPALVAEVTKARGPYKISAVADVAGRAALAEDREWVQGIVQNVRRARAELSLELRLRGLETVPSEANFLLVKVGVDPVELAKRMRGMGVGVRAFPNVRSVGDAIRITVGPREMMVRGLEVLDACL